MGDDADALPNWQALVLGLVQGATELLPISSSGHLILVPWAADWEYLKEHDAFNQTFDVSLHLGTLVAVVVYFWHDIVRLAGAWLGTLRRRRVETPDERIAWYVAAATVPAALVGALGENLIAENLGEPWQIAILLALFAVLLYVADRRPEEKDMSQVGLKAAVGGGARADALADARRLALGDHDHGGRFLGLDRDSAARFSFLLLVPITFGAVLYKGWGTYCWPTSRRGRRGRSWSDRWPRSRPRWSRSRPCSGTSAATTTPCSSSTASSSPRSCCC